MKKIVATAMICCIPSIGMAQLLNNDDIRSVKERQNRDLEPLGMPLRSFLLHPGLETHIQYDDNIFRDDTNNESDLITTISPSVNVISNWSIHQLRFFANADIAKYADNSDENYEDFSLGMGGRFDIAHDTFVHGDWRFEHKHEDRSSPDDVNGDRPTEFDVLLGRLGFTRALAKVQLFLEGRVRDIDYDNATQNGTVIDNSFRNRTQYEADAKIAYEFIPNYEVYVRGILDNRNYETTPFPDRTSDGYSVEVGTDINISGKIKAQVSGGYIERDYGASFTDVSTEDFGANVLWNLNGLTSLTGDIDRRVIETTGVGVSGYIRTSYTIGLEHAFAHNILGEASASFMDDEFVGGAREDENYRVNVGITYKPMRGAETGIYYDYTNRDSNQDANDFNNHSLALRAQYTF